MTRPRRARPPCRFRLHALGLALTAALGAAPPTLGQPAPTPTPVPAAPAAPAPPPAKPWYEEIAVNAFVSASYSYNFNRPDSGTNQLRVFDFDDNSFKVDVAEVVLQKAISKPGEAGFRIDFEAGSSIPRVSSSFGLLQGQDVDLQQAFLSWIAPVGSGLRLDLGKFVTHFGYEVIEGYDGYNDNATRSFLFGFETPGTHTGLKASYTFSDQLAGMFEICNGWDVARDNNSSKSLGLQLTWTPSKTVTVYGNFMTGPERANVNSDPRSVFDVVAQWKLNDLTVFTLDAVYGTEKGAVTPGKTASWSGVVGYARLGLSDAFALCLRAEYFKDADGARTGTIQKVKEVTVTPEYKVSTHLILRGDLRVDWSDADVFGKKDGVFKGSQATVLLNGIYLF
ncbi:MAG TPA: porin [Thermoanaerobaculia bacterium]|nr:porin [Thermoanaerobaculia bacterium]